MGSPHVEELERSPSLDITIINMNYAKRVVQEPLIEKCYSRAKIILFPLVIN